MKKLMIIMAITPAFLLGVTLPAAAQDENPDAQAPKTGDYGTKTKRAFVEQRMQWAKKNPTWNPTREDLEEQFDQLDTNEDGLLTPDEENAGKKDKSANVGPGSVGAAGGLTKTKFVKQRMQWAKNNPSWNPTEEQLEANFDELDTDGDGLLSEDEEAAGKKNKPAKMGSGSAGQNGAMTKPQFVKQRMQWAKNDPSWNPTEEQLEAKFDELDIDGDGSLSAEEQAAGKK